MTIPDALMQDFSRFLATRIGLWFPRTRWPDLARGMTRIAQLRGFPEPAACMRGMMATSLGQTEVEMLALHLSISETYFFRDPALFNLLEHTLLPPLISARRAAHDRRLRIWSAGCCTGEELYSLAILLARLLPDLDHWKLDLLGTDINPLSLEKAARGVYRDWSFRNLAPQIRQRHFTRGVDGSYTILPQLQRMVRFEHHNLAGDAPLPADRTTGIDLIVCRNVLMYFDAAQIRHAVQEFHRVLADGGCLIVGAAETGHDAFAPFESVMFADALLYRKTTRPAAPYPAQAQPAPVAETTALAWQPSVEIPEPSPIPATWSAVSAPVSPAPAASAPHATPYEIALRHYQQGQYQQVVAALQPAGEASPTSLLLLARAHANLGELEAALQSAQLALAHDTCNPALRYLLALIQAEQGQHDAAIASLKQALYLDPGFVLAHFYLGNAYRKQGRPLDAQRHFNNATDLLRHTPASQILMEAEGITAGRLIEIIQRQESAA